MKHVILFSIFSFFISEIAAQNEYAYATSLSGKIIETSTSTSVLSSEEKQMLTVSDVSDMLSKYLEYPDEMISYGLEGSCMLVINLSKKGSLISYKVEESLGLLFDIEIQRVLKENGYLIPENAEGQQRGLRIKIPIHFNF